MTEIVTKEECRHEAVTREDLSRNIPAVVQQLVASCGTSACFDHVSPAPIPSLDSVVEVLHLARRILFPGYFTSSQINSVSLAYYLGQEITTLFQKLAVQITLSIRHDCFRYEQPCSQCTQQGQEKAIAFIEALPGVRNVLATDIRAAYEGDPASQSYDEIIYCYPGLYAITIYRLAHILYGLQVPLLPRIMTEYAHTRTGIDIHPGATIGEHFFIDHGTGVVIGETTEIGASVRLYQGVTLGALSLPRDAGQRLRSQKRHPTIEDEVIVYAGATILGGETRIGARSVIGGNVWLTESVPPDTKVLIKTPELVFIGNRKGGQP